MPPVEQNHKTWNVAFTLQKGDIYV